MITSVLVGIIPDLFPKSISAYEDAAEWYFEVHPLVKGLFEADGEDQTWDHYQYLKEYNYRNAIPLSIAQMIAVGDSIEFSTEDILTHKSLGVPLKNQYELDVNAVTDKTFHTVSIARLAGLSLVVTGKSFKNVTDKESLGVVEIYTCMVHRTEELRVRRMIQDGSYFETGKSDESDF